MTALSAAHLETFGFVVLPAALDPTALTAEFDASMLDAFDDPNHMNSGAAGNQFRYVPMMSERTPVSLALVTRLSTMASDLLGAPVLPVRAKATSYRGSTKWHRDTDLPVRSIGFAFYLEPLTQEAGSLRVLPGSHRADFADAIQTYVSSAGDDPKDLPGFAVPTLPGDAIVFDEHLYHASSGGSLRRQWRVDFVVDLPGNDKPLRDYFGRIYSTGWDGGYDVDRFPSYGKHWRTLNSHWNERLDTLGVYRAAAAEESYVRKRR